MPASGAIKIGLVQNNREVRKALERFDRATDATRLAAWLVTDAEEHLQVRAAARFESEGDSASGQWHELRPRTVEIRKWLGLPGEHPINRRRGNLRSFVTSAQGLPKRGSGEATLIWPGKIPRDVLKKYKGAQQGAKRTKVAGGSPPRPAVAINEIDSAMLTESLGAWIDSIAKLS